MAYFVKENKRHEPKPSAFVCGVKPIPELPPHQHADAIKDQKIAAMQGGATDFVYRLDVKGMKAPPTGRKTTEASPRVPGSQVFQEAKVDPAPNRRIRTGVSDDELRKIWQEDERKQVAAKAMMERTDMVEKMHKETYPVAYRKDVQPPVKKQIGMTRPEENTNEPAGLKGVGAYCAKPAGAGRACREQPEFEAPVMPAPKKPVVKRQAPPDTWSMGIDPNAPPMPTRADYGMR
jgi:hypothetical protein